MQPRAFASQDAWTRPITACFAALQAYTAIDEGQPLDEEVFQQFLQDPVHKVRSAGP